MAKIRFIGDIHGNIPQYLDILDRMPDDVTASVQIGDFGMGFGPNRRAEVVDPFLDAIPGIHKFIRGNHDDPDECRRSTHYIEDGSVFGNTMYIGGAASIDKHLRTEGVDWWPGEEASVAELDALITKYEETKPNILVTHECPDFFANEVMIPYVNGYKNFRSMTREALDVMYSIRKPLLHIFGHWHKNLVHDYKGTRFVCLQELAYMDIDITDLESMEL